MFALKFCFTVYNWCKKRIMTIIEHKSEKVYFRNDEKCLTDFTLKNDPNIIEILSSYKHLVVILNGVLLI